MISHIILTANDQFFNFESSITVTHRLIDLGIKFGFLQIVLGAD